MADLDYNKNIEVEADGLPEGFLILDDQGDMFQLSHGALQPFKQKNTNKKVAATENSSELLDTGMEEAMLQPPPLAVLKNSAAFYFHPEDEEEVLRTSAKTLVENGPRQFSVQKIAAKTEDSFGLSLNPEGKKKLVQLILMAMRDRRSLVDTEALLQDEENSLGLGLPAPIAGALMVFLSEIKNKISKEGGLVVDESVINDFNKNLDKKPEDVKPLITESKPRRSVIEEIAQEIKSGKVASEIPNSEDQKNESKQNVVEENLPHKPSDEFSVSLNLREAINQKMVDKDAVIAPKPAPAKPVVFDKPTSQNLSRFVKTVKPAIADIKIDNKSVGPIDELSLINLATFRRISADPATASQRIIAIVRALGKQSLARKMAGITAWRKCPLYRQYLSIGQLSMETGKYIPEVIKDLMAKGTDVMTLLEFEAISDINKQIRL